VLRSFEFATHRKVSATSTQRGDACEQKGFLKTVRFAIIFGVLVLRIRMKTVRCSRNFDRLHVFQESCRRINRRQVQLEAVTIQLSSYRKESRISFSSLVFAFISFVSTFAAVLIVAAHERTFRCM
jgi:hypothetical protein